MRDHRTTAELQSIVGPQRAAHSPRMVARAERELAIRGESEEALFQRKLTRSGTIAAVIGAVCIVWPLAILLAFSRSDMPVGNANPAEPFVFRHFDLIFNTVAILQILCGVLLLLGGLALRSRKRMGPPLLAAPIVVAMVYLVAFPVSLFIGGPLGEAPVLFSLFFTGFAALWSAFLLFMFWLPLRFFLSSRVKEACARGAQESRPV